MRKYYREYAVLLYEKGYCPIPIRPKSKIPFFGKGESWQVDVDKSLVSKWAENGKGSGNVAVKDIGAIDCDIYDEGMANALIKYLRENINKNIPIRTGQKPKFLVPLAPSEAINHKKKITWYDKTGRKQEIEILSPGDQYFVCYGMHPSGVEYEWMGNIGIVNTPVCDLPIIDELDLASLEDFFDLEAKKRGWTKQGPEKPKATKGVCGAQEEDIKVPGKRDNPAGLAELRVWLKHLDQACCDDRDEWVRIGAAIHFETAGSSAGYAVFDEWSRNSEKYNGMSDTMKRWESYHSTRGVNGSGCVTAGTIVQAIRDGGEDVWIAAKTAGKEARDAFVEAIEATGGVCSEKTHVEDSEDEIADAISFLNERHAVVSIVGKIKVMNFKDKGLNGDLDFSSVSDFHHKYANQRITIGGKNKKKMPISKIWMTHKDRREYDGIVFEPGRDAGKNYNLWNGFAIEPKQGDWSLFKEHVEKVICCGNKKTAAWTFAWMANILQNPGGQRSGTAIVMQGKQGTGKGVFANAWSAILGAHFIQVSSGGQITGRFNSHLKDKIVAFVDEAFWGGDKRAEGVLKSIITEPHINIEQKGVDSIRVENHLNIIVASNNEWVVPAGLEERRFNVVEVSDIHQQDTKYFKTLCRQLYQEGGIEAMMYDLMRMDISNYDLTKFETSDALLSQKFHTMRTHEKFWLEKLISGDIGGNDTPNTDFGRFVSGNEKWSRVKTSDLYDDYLDFANKLKEQYPLTPTQFGIALKKFCPLMRKKRVTMPDGTRQLYYQPPILEDCRDEFAIMLKKPDMWETILADITTEYEDEVPF